MSFDVLTRTFDRIFRDTNYDGITFVWHGGEPTLLPVSFFQKALILQSRFRRSWQVVRNVFQTNATRLNGTWIKFLKRHEFSVGVSLDGPAFLHNRNRPYVCRHGSFKAVMRGINLLRDAGVKFGVLMVIDRDALNLGADRIFDFFLEHGINNYGLLAATPANRLIRQDNESVDHYISPQSFSSFLVRMFDLRQLNGDPNVRIREIDAIEKAIHGIRGNRALTCRLAGHCIGHVFSVEPNGEIGHCDLFLGDPDYVLGNIFHQSFKEMRLSKKFRVLAQREKVARARMRNCQEFNVCQGWCQHERYLSRRYNSLYDDGCCGLRDLIRHIRAALPAERVSNA